MNVILKKKDAIRREKFLKISEGKFFLRRQLSVFIKLIDRYSDFR